MENFVVSARKYRPATFDTVVGQEHITTTLRNAIRTNHLASAFLFCGPRGVGKTTCARILAKTINCQNLSPEAEACDHCDSCVSFNRNASFNIHELDAASNNSVEDIRSLIDQVRTPPQSGAKYKIYIIDEVHMLSTQAFNAFLKTLEEPPSYAIFILATTEKHKILPTILSRCQIFDFNRIQPAHIASHLADIAQKEGITAEPEALDLIAQKADGGLRDALSMFDLNVTFAADRIIRYKEVLDNLHILDYDYYFTLTDYLLAGNLPQSLLTVDEILRKGFDGHQFVVGLCRHFRDLLVCKDAATVQLLQVTENVRRQYLDQAVRAPMSFLLSALSLGGQCDMNYKQAKDQRLHTELWLMKLANLRNLLNWDALPDQLAAPTALNGLRNGAGVVAEGSIDEKKNAGPTLGGPTLGGPTLGGSTPGPPLPSSPSPSPDPLTETHRQSEHPITSEPVRGYQLSPAAVATDALPTETTRNGHAPAQNGAATVALPTRPPIAPLPRPATSRLRSTVSLTPGSVQAVTTEVEVSATVPLRPNRSFDTEELLAVWLEFAKVRRQQNDSATEQLVLNRTLTLDGTTIHITLDNTLQVGYLTEVKPELLGYLRDKLQNSQIQLEHTVTQQEVKKMLYSAQDKYNFMAEKNPVLHELRKVLNLEVDY